MTTLSSAPATPASTRPARKLGAVVVRLGIWSLSLGLIGLNAWWLWDARPMPDLRQVARWISTPRNAEAEAVLWRAVRKSPYDGEARFLLARALGASGNPRGFAEQAHQVPFWSASKPEALYGEGLAWQEIYCAGLAEQAFRQYLIDDPNHPEQVHPFRVQVEERLLNLYALEDRWAVARPMLYQAYEDKSAGPTGRRIWLMQLMRTYLERPDPAASIGPLRQFVAADPEDWEAQLALARAAATLKLDEESDLAFAAVLKARPTDPEVWGDWLEALLARHDLPALEAASKAAPPEADTCGRVWFVRGQAHEDAYKENRDSQEIIRAAEAYRHAVALLPFDPRIHYRLNLAEQRLGHPQAAEAHRLRHAEIEKFGNDLPLAMNAYAEATEAKTVNPVAVKACIQRFIIICRGLGLTKEAEFWTRELAAS